MEGRVTRVRAMERRRRSPPDIPCWKFIDYSAIDMNGEKRPTLRSAPPTIVSAASLSPNSWIVCSTTSRRVSAEIVAGSRSAAEHSSVSRTAILARSVE